MNRGLNRTEIWCGGSLCISDDLFNFWEKIMWNEMAGGENFEKMADQKALWAWYLMNCELDRAQIWCGGSTFISDDLVNFWRKIIKNKIVDKGLLKNCRPKSLFTRVTSVSPLQTLVFILWLANNHHQGLQILQPLLLLSHLGLWEKNSTFRMVASQRAK